MSSGLWPLNTGATSHHFRERGCVRRTSRSNAPRTSGFKFSSAFLFSHCCDWLAAQLRSSADAKLCPFNTAMRFCSCATSISESSLFRFPRLAQHRAPFLDAFLDFLFHALVGRLVIPLVRAEIILRHKMLGMVVRILISLAVAEPFRAGVMRVAQMLGHRERATGT